MSRPIGPEGDLSRIIEQVNRNRRQQGLRDQTQAEYRTVMTNRMNSLLAICSQPDVQYLINTPGILNCIITMHPEPTNLNIRETAQGEYNFFLEFYGYGRIDKGGLTRKRRINEIISSNKINISILNNNLNLDTNTEWQMSEYYSQVLFGKKITTEDFMRHPVWLELFESSLSAFLDRTHVATGAQIGEQQRRIAQFSGRSVEEVARELQSGAQVTELDLRLTAQGGAKAVTEGTNIVPSGLTEEQVRIIVAEMITERLAAIQLAPHNPELFTTTPDIDRNLRQFAHGDTAAASLMQRFMTRSRDPQKVFQALSALSQLIPGTTQIRAVLEAANIMFGPEETTR